MAESQKSQVSSQDEPPLEMHINTRDEHGRIQPLTPEIVQAVSVLGRAALARFNKPLNTTQLAALRLGADNIAGQIHSSRDTAKALVHRLLAREDQHGHFWITQAGRIRAKRKADVVVHRDGVKDDPSLLEDLA